MDLVTNIVIESVTPDEEHRSDITHEIQFDFAGRSHVVYGDEGDVRALEEIFALANQLETAEEMEGYT